MDWPTGRLDMTPFTGAKTRLNTTFTQPYFRICLSLASPGLYQGVFTHLGFRLPFWMRLWETCCVNSEKWLIIDEWKIPDLVRFLSPIIFYYVTNEQLESLRRRSYDKIVFTPTYFTKIFVKNVTDWTQVLSVTLICTRRWSRSRRRQPRPNICANLISEASLLSSNSSATILPS